MNIIATDCTGEKFSGLQSVVREHFGPFGSKIIPVEKKEFCAPLSFIDLEKITAERLAHIMDIFEKNDYVKDTIYYATVQKGFIQSLNKTWMLTAYALFRKEKSAWFSGTAEWVSIPQEIAPFIPLPEKERYEKFYEMFPQLKTMPLVTFCSGINQDEWIKRAFRSCIKTATK